MRTPAASRCSHVFLLVGGAQAFASPFHRRGFVTGRANEKLWENHAVSNGLNGRSPSSSSSLSVLKDLANEGKTSGSASAEAAEERPAAVSGTVVIADDPQFIKSLPEKRSYRVVRLPNSLTALLASDPATDVESASVHVRAGHFDDPPSRAGLAHFHEHMLFLGTEKYPREDEYEDYLGRHGGTSNAYTDMEDTNYYFNVSPLDEEGKVADASGGVSAALGGALDRFAQFFVAPLFDQSMLERELRAVNSEYLNGKTADNWRNFQLLKHGASQDHPFSKFGCGNYETLTNGGDEGLKGPGAEDGAKDGGEEDGAGSGVDFGGGSSPRDALVEFWTEKYHAGNLRLCVVGRASLDDLQATVEAAFGTVRPPPPGFVANGIMDQMEAGELSVPGEGGADDAGGPVFQTEHSTYAPNVAFGPDQLGLLREVVPLVESRTLKVFSAVPPLDDPVLRGSRPFRVLSHLVGHESPGSLHHLLTEEGWINNLASGTGISTSDFCLANIAITLTPKGMRERDLVLEKTWQWFALIKDAVANDPQGLIARYHDELRTITDTSFKYREMGDPTDFCSSAAESLFDYEPEKILLGTAEVGDYDVEVARAFLERFTPQNSLVVVTGPELGEEEIEKSSVSARDAEWQMEERYGAKYRQIRVSDALAEEWNHPTEIDPRLRLPGLNEFIPEDLSLRCEDPEQQADADANPDFDYRKQTPKLLVDTPKLRMWHKMDRTFRVPKTSIRLQLTSPDIYRSPRSITLNRIFSSVLSDDLNSYVYDASVAGCNYRVSCTPSAYGLSVSGYSEKLPYLLDVVTSRIASLIEEMKEGEGAHPALAGIFYKSKENLLRQTKNYIFESPYETGSYNLRMLLETPVWHIEDYTSEMEGPDAEAEPLTMKECAEAAEQCLFGRSKAVSLCIGNIDEKGSREVADVISKNFLKKRPLNDDETPRFRSLRMPNKAEATRIFGAATEVSEVPVVYEAVAHSESEENNAVELYMQTTSSYELGYEGLAIQEVMGSMAYNSAFNQLRTKEQLGYIVSAFVKKSSGGGNAFCVLVQSSNTSPPEIEERCLRWVEQFRQEMEDMPEERFAMEAASVRASLLEKDIKLSEEISSVWGEILSTVPHSEHFKNPVFDRVEKFANVLTLDGAKGEGGEDDTESDGPTSIKSAADLKKRVLEFYDKYFMSPEHRRAVSSRVYNRKGKELFDQNVGKPGVISSYDDASKLKQHLASFPTAPYW